MYELLNLLIHWVDNEYLVYEDYRLVRGTRYKKQTLFSVIKDLLIRCNIPLCMWGGQAYV